MGVQSRLRELVNRQLATSATSGQDRKSRKKTQLLHLAALARFATASQMHHLQSTCRAGQMLVVALLSPAWPHDHRLTRYRRNNMLMCHLLQRNLAVQAQSQMPTNIPDLILQFASHSL